MMAAGLDLGGTKIETQVFDAKWACVERRRIPTPQAYDDLVASLADSVAWADHCAGGAVPVGIAVAGLVNPATGLVYATNLAAMGRPLLADVTAKVTRRVTSINDCRALALSEAVFGAGQGFGRVAALVLGTGLGGGFAVDGRLAKGFAGVGGEFGHVTLSAHVLRLHDLPVLACGCGRTGCTETLLSGPGLSRIAQRLMGRAVSPEELVAARAQDAGAAQTWAVWCDLLADLLITLLFTLDPEVIVMGGGMSQIPGLAGDVALALQRGQLPGFGVPQVVIAQGGDASGARGAAYAAVQDAGHDVGQNVVQDVRRG